MLSILIPTFNYNVFPLVSELRAQCEENGIPFEIRVFDDGSRQFHTENHQINQFTHCSYSILERNIGRSSIRNLLAKNAAYNNLLFLDADVFPKEKTFISTYVNAIETTERIVSGGLVYQEEKPAKKLLLRWTYGKQRESIPASKRLQTPYLSLLSSNFMATKSILQQVPFNESIPDLRREDTLFSYDMMQHHILIMHLDNPVYHFGIDAFETVISKEKESLDGLKYLLDHGLLPYNYLKISRLYHTIKNLGLTSAVAKIHQLTEKSLLKNLSSDQPSLILFDLYRIGYFCRNGQHKS